MYRSCLVLVCVLVLAASGSGLVACGGGDAAPDAAVPFIDGPPEDGTLSLTWSIRNGDATLACSDVGALSVSVVAVPSAGGFGVPTAFSCDQGSGLSQAIPADVYDIEISLVAGGNADLVEPIKLYDFVLQAGAINELGDFPFEVAPVGVIELVIDNEDGLPSCEPEPDGAGITAVSIELRNAQGQCVPAVLDIAAGASLPEGTYNADCAGATYGCIAKDQTIRIAEAPSGPSSMVITAYKGDVACFTRTPQFTVPGGGLTYELLPQRLVRDLALPECEQAQ